MHRFVTLWIICCIILHNLIIRIEEDTGFLDGNEWPGEGDVEADGEGIEIDDKIDAGNMQIDLEMDGVEFRRRVMAELFKRR